MKQSPFIFSDEPKYRIRRHLAFWVFWWLFQAVLYSFVAFGSKAPYWILLCASVVHSLAFITIHIFLAYSLMYFVIPRYLLKQKYWLTAGWVILLFILTAALSTLIRYTVIDALQRIFLSTWYKKALQFSPENISLSLMAGLRGGITIGGIAAAIKLMKYWYVKEQRNLQLQKENAEAQLQLLKAQVHPHFLFNTLNNIYSHTQGSNPVASQLVMGLSDMLRFMLYECNQPLVPLWKELALVRDYITLEMIRYDERLDVQIDIPQNTNHLGITPLLLLPLVENCFKHGTSNMLEQPWLSLQVTLDKNTMHMKLVNGKAEGQSPAGSSGIGISNVRKRLELQYPGKHKMIINNDADVFIVNLWLQLETLTPSRKKEQGSFMPAY